MMKRFLGGVLLGMAMLALFCFSASARAEEMDRTAYINGALRKLGRGIANIATCPGEIPRTVSLVGREKGVVAESSVGVVQGLWRMLLRGLTGVYEVGSFFVETPKNFEPIMKPEYIWADSSWQE